MAKTNNTYANAVAQTLYDRATTPQVSRPTTNANLVVKDPVASMRNQMAEQINANFSMPSTSGFDWSGYQPTYNANAVKVDTSSVAPNNLVSTTLANGDTASFVKNLNDIDVPADPGTVTGGTGGTDSGTDAYQAALAQVLASYQAAENEKANALRQNYEQALAQAQNSFNAGKDNLRQATDDALRQAYISYMLGQRGLNQQLANGGINGGATESVLANLYNNYGNNRADIQTAYQSNLANLVDGYNNNVANLGMNYNTNYADALADYNKQVAATKQSYANALATKLAKTSPEDTTRKNAVTTVSKFVNNPAGALQYASVLKSKGYTDDEIDEIMFDAGISPVDLQRYVAEQG